MALARRYAIGAEPNADGTHFRVWAPRRRTVELVELGPRRRETGKSHRLEPERDGYHSLLVPGIGDGALYGYRLDGEREIHPDPASRFQPDGPLGPSQVVDPRTYEWRDAGWGGTRERGQVLYELHVGTFTKEGTYEAAAKELQELADLGITTIEMMPVADFPGRFGWGYDGVNLWAPTRLYGAPNALKRFIDEAHRHGVAVILDVVYNHLGPVGNPLKAFSEDYFTDRYENEWGEPLDFDGENSAPVREYFIENARYWVEEYHFDGLRLDATQSIFDASERHVIAEVTEAARAAARARGRRIFIVAENEPQEPKMVRPVERGGYGCDALWNDDFHHTARVALTGRREAYYHDYGGTPQELVSALKWGYLFQGQHYFWQKKRRGRPALTLGSASFVTYLQNHDQIANSLTGERIDHMTSPALLRAITALMLLAPPTPMLFQGQEFGASAPFLYFADHDAELMRAVNRDRKKFLAQFPSIALPESQARLTDASDPSTFERCKLDFGERVKHQETYELFRDLLRLRREDPAFSQERVDRMHGAVLAEHAFLLRFFCDQGDRLVVVNLGPELALEPCPEPLLAPPEESSWELLFSSEHPRYGGKGFAPISPDGKWLLGACSTTVYAANAG